MHARLGRPLWFELATTDVAAARNFYTHVVGWSVKDSEGLGMPYSEWLRADGTPVGGLMALPDELKAEGVPPHWMVYVGVDDLDARAATVERLGGGALTPVIEVPTVGRLQTMRDPDGAAFSLYAPESEPGPETAPAPGDLAWLELHTSDPAAGLAFYTTLFGWQPTEAMDMGPMGTYQMFGRGAAHSIGGVMRKPAGITMPSAWLLYVKVPDVVQAADRVRASGGTIVNGPADVPGGQVVMGVDPQGAAFALYSGR
ncbi:MAG: VOC family protein [Acidobacteria bacterium]|nr:VOC family protein [Acidobacteriota bacterium]